MTEKNNRKPDPSQAPQNNRSSAWVVFIILMVLSLVVFVLLNNSSGTAKIIYPKLIEILEKNQFDEKGELKGTDETLVVTVESKAKKPRTWIDYKKPTNIEVDDRSVYGTIWSRKRVEGKPDEKFKETKFVTSKPIADETINKQLSELLEAGNHNY